MLQQRTFYPHLYARERSQAESWALLRRIELAGDFRYIGAEGYHYEANETLPNENQGYF
ncbi:MAG: hypothetical protein H0V86_03545 [Chloroflexia bacterium]|nr:hypothetical protein [Chloroflexia bacterium]